MTDNGHGGDASDDRRIAISLARPHPSPIVARSLNVASFVLCRCPIVAKTAIPTSGAAKIVEIAIRFWGCLALSRNQKLFPHFREARTEVFTV
jgi:hypothetical protein